MRLLTFATFSMLLLACDAPAPGSTDTTTGSAAARESTWVFSVLDPPGSAFTFPTGINDRGSVTFQFADESWTAYHAAVLERGAYTVIDVPGANDTLAGAPGADGQVPLAWANWTEEGRLHQALWTRGTITPLPDAPGWQHISPSGMTASGLVCGAVWNDATPDFVGYLWDGTAFTFLSHPASDISYTALMGCNARGDVVGSYATSAGEISGWLWSDGAWLDVRYPGAEASVATSISASGAIAGTYGDVGNGPFGIAVGGHGFVLEHGRFVTIDYPGALASFPTGINARGDVVGAWFDEEGNLHGYLAERR